MTVDKISIEVFRNLLSSVAEEMGVTLGRTSYSANMKERRDYSCAVFDPSGNMVAQAAHIPVHLGAMTASVKAGLERLSLKQGDIAILNDPFLGGTHLPDISLMAPVYDNSEQLLGFVANRGHHADVGGMTPGSLPLSNELYQEGIIIPPLKLVESGVTNDALLEIICRNTRTPDERIGDFNAQIAAIHTGQIRLNDLSIRYGTPSLHSHMSALLDYSHKLTLAALSSLPNGQFAFEDYIEDDGLGNEHLKIACTVTLSDGKATFDFSGTSGETQGCVNTPLAVTESAVLYAVRCIAGTEIPGNDGVRRALSIQAPEGSLVNALPPRAVSGGNVETSQRITDVLFGALAKAAPNLIPAASQGTMNNVLAGGTIASTGRSFSYYETIGGGTGGGPNAPGASALQSHMTNTLNTPIEALEYSFPIRVRSYGVRHKSGGRGLHSGGDGVIRELEFLENTTVTVISERRNSRPYGLEGGEPGKAGSNKVIKADGSTVTLPAKSSRILKKGDILRVSTPGGGGWGKPE